jgi:8-hydroxy-5-deazaflavin:NADPH oxidoreductase
MTNTTFKSIAVLGGTGKEGKGLAYRWAKAGIPVIIGSRSADRASETARELNDALKTQLVTGADNLSAAKSAVIVVLSVPYQAHRDTIESVKSALSGKILIDVTVPLIPPKVAKVQMPPAGSAAQEAREILGEGIEVASAFQNISYEHLIKEEKVECDVLVTGTSKETRAVALDLVLAAGLKGWDAGALENSMVAEGLTSILIHINKLYGSNHAGITITGVDRSNKMLS